MSSEKDVNYVKTALLIIKGAVSEFPPEDQEKIRQCKEALTEVVKANGDHGLLAIAMLSAELEIEAHEGGEK